MILFGALAVDEVGLFRVALSTKRVLELGCGGGFFANELTKRGA